MGPPQQNGVPCSSETSSWRSKENVRELTFTTIVRLRDFTFDFDRTVDQFTGDVADTETFVVQCCIDQRFIQILLNAVEHRWLLAVDLVGDGVNHRWITMIA